MTDLPQKSQFLIYQAENGDIKIDVRFEQDTVWLSQPSMAELFHTTQQNISVHLQNIYEECELLPEATHKEFLLVRREGSRDVQRRVTFYNLDAIISVGYRVKSRIATQFRVWATQRLREYWTCPETVDTSRSPRKGDEVIHGRASDDQSGIQGRCRCLGAERLTQPTRPRRPQPGEPPV